MYPSNKPITKWYVNLIDLINLTENNVIEGIALLEIMFNLERIKKKHFFYS